MLGRIDRRIVTSGSAQMQLESERLHLDGRFAVDEGLIDFSKSDAPALSDDVVVKRAADPKAAAPVRSSTTPARLPSVALDLRVDLGQS